MPPQRGDWKYKLAFRFPLPKRGGERLFTLVFALGSRIRAALPDEASATYQDAAYDGETVALTILTDTPKATFKLLRQIVERHAAGVGYEVAYRRLKTREWTTLRQTDKVDSDEPEWTHHLVYQFGLVDGDLAQYDDVIALEDQLIEAIDDGKPIAVVDGHDSGAGEINIFVLTNAPREAFERLRPIVDRSAAARRSGYRAAYRRLDGDAYHDLWAADDAPPFRVD